MIGSEDVSPEKGACVASSNGDVKQEYERTPLIITSADSATTSADLNASEPSGNVEVHIEFTRTVGVIQLSFLAFFLTSGGPFGIEDVVHAGGPLPTLIGFVLLPIMYCLPQALMTAELSNMESLCTNGGHVVWVEYAFGNCASWFNGWNSFINRIVDVAVYPVLFVDYLELLPTVGKLHPFESFSIKLALIIVVVYLNVRGLDVVSKVAVVTTFLILAPFAVEFFLQVDSINPSDWNVVAKDVDWALFMTGMLWLYTGWDKLGAVAGEVANPQRTYPKAVVASILMNLAVYIVPLIVGLTVAPDYLEWEAGFLSTAAYRIRPWLGYWVTTAGMLSAFGMVNTNVSTVARSVWAFAGGTPLMRPKMPTIFNKEHPKYGTPLGGILLLAATTLILVQFDFGILVQCDIFFNSVVLLFEFSAFLWLRYKEPNAARGYKVPGGWFGAWVMTISKASIVFGVLIASSWQVWAIGVGSNILLAVAYFGFWKPWNKRQDMLLTDDDLPGTELADIVVTPTL